MRWTVYGLLKVWAWSCGVELKLMTLRWPTIMANHIGVVYVTTSRVCKSQLYLYYIQGPWESTISVQHPGSMRVNHICTTSRVYESQPYLCTISSVYLGLSTTFWVYGSQPYLYNIQGLWESTISVYNIQCLFGSFYNILGLWESTISVQHPGSMRVNHICTTSRVYESQPYLYNIQGPFGSFYNIQGLWESTIFVQYPGSISVNHIKLFKRSIHAISGCTT